MFQLFRVFAFLALALAVPQLAHAHAVLVASTPKLNQVVHNSELHIDLKFNSRVDGPRCTLTLISTDGKPQLLQLIAQNSPDEVAADAKDLHKGIYKLRWQALASDGHITRGEIPFRVA